MIKNECEIVKDLFNGYDEDKVCEKTKEFVKEHLKQCKRCNDELESLKKDKLEKKKCEIVKDLLTNYEEGIVSSSTKEFIEEHLKDCLKCKEALELIKEDKIQEEKTEKDREKPVINYLKKIENRLALVHNGYLVFIVIIFVLISLLLIAYA